MQHQVYDYSPLNFLESTTAKKCRRQGKVRRQNKNYDGKKIAVVNEIYDGKIKSTMAEFVVQVFAHVVLTIAIFNRKS